MLSPEEKELLERVAQQTEENNRILRGLRAKERWRSFGGAVKIAIFIALAGLAYWYSLPYLRQIQTMYQDIQGLKSQAQTAIDKAPTLPSPEDIRGFFGF